MNNANYHANKDVRLEQSRVWKEANPDKWDEVKERSRLKKYGLTLEQHQELFERQNGSCAICSDVLTGRVHIDHDHTTGNVRGLLCHRCNVGLGHFRDVPALLRKAAEYLEIRNTTGLVVQRPIRIDRPGDGRHKVTEVLRQQVRALREQGLSLGCIASNVGLSRSWVQVILKSH